MADFDRAFRRAENLLRRLGQGAVIPDRTEAFLADVAFHLERYWYVLHELRRETVPCIVDDDGVAPIDLSSLAFRLWPERDVDVAAVIFSKLKVEFLPLEDIGKILLPRLASFIAVRSSDEDENPSPRAAAVGAAPFGFSSVPGYLQVQVRTERQKLRIHFSPSYLIDWSNVFGAPTSPVDGWIRPGRYKFAGLSRTGEWYVDNSNFDIPPFYGIDLNF